MGSDDRSSGGKASQQHQGLGCAVALALLNLVAMGVIASTFATLSYSDAEQEGWYRGGSIGFLSIGAILPLLWLLLIRRGYRGSIIAIIAWMFAVLLAFLGYVFMSSGGV